MRPIIYLLLFVLAASMIIIPTVFVMLFNEKHSTEDFQKMIELESDPKENIIVNVYRTSTKKIESYSLEEYVRGVVAAEMPIDFELEALKAQALAARTYIVKRIIDKNYTDVPEGAMVTDTIQHQVFLSDEELKKLWDNDYNHNVSRLNEAINETIGQVITYEGQPINALFFSTSNGYTENSEDYWQKKVPYLRSVLSKWDVQSPKYLGTVHIPFSTISSKLNVDTAVAASTGQNWMKIIETTDGQRVKKIKIGNKTFTGREIRELFNLNSSSFTFQMDQDGITFNTKGYGHGVGMSQYGANGMAKEGGLAEDIVKYYYTGVKITDIQKWVTKKE